MLCFRVPSRKAFLSPAFNLEKHFRPFRSSFKLPDFRSKLDLFRVEHAELSLVWPCKSKHFVLGRARLPLDELMAVYVLFLKQCLSDSDARPALFEPDPVETERVKFLLSEDCLRGNSHQNPLNLACTEQTRQRVLGLIRAAKACYRGPDTRLHLAGLVEILEQLCLLFGSIDPTLPDRQPLSGFERFERIKAQWARIADLPFAFKHCAALEKSEFLESFIDSNQHFRHFHRNKGDGDGCVLTGRLGAGRLRGFGRAFGLDRPRANGREALRIAAPANIGTAGGLADGLPLGAGRRGHTRRVRLRRLRPGGGRLEVIARALGDQANPKKVSRSEEATRGSPDPSDSASARAHEHTR